MNKPLQEEPCHQLRKQMRGDGSGVDAPTGEPVPQFHGTSAWASESLSASPWLSSELASRRGAGKGAAGGALCPLPPAPQPPHFGFRVRCWRRYVQRTASSGNGTRDAGMCSPHPSLLPETPIPPPRNWAEGLRLHKAEWPWPKPEAPCQWTPGWSAHVQRKGNGQRAHSAPQPTVRPAAPPAAGAPRGVLLVLQQRGCVQRTDSDKKDDKQYLFHLTSLWASARRKLLSFEFSLPLGGSAAGSAGCQGFQILGWGSTHVK